MLQKLQCCIMYKTWPCKNQPVPLWATCHSGHPWNDVQNKVSPVHLAEPETPLDKNMTLDVVNEILFVPWNRNYLLTDVSGASYTVGFSWRLAWFTWFKGRKKNSKCQAKQFDKTLFFSCIAVTVRSSPSLGWSFQVLVVVYMSPCPPWKGMEETEVTFYAL